MYILQVKIIYKCVEKFTTNILLDFCNSFFVIEISRKYPTHTIYVMRRKTAYEMKYTRLGTTNFLENCCL